MNWRKYLLASLLVVCGVTGCRQKPTVFSGYGALPPTGHADPIGWQNEANELLASPQRDTPPVTLYEFENLPRWHMTLQDAFRIALENSEVIRASAFVDAGGGTVTLRGNLNGLRNAPSVYDPELTETDPNQGLHRALSEFDSQLSTSIFWDTINQPQNFGFFLPVLQQNQGHFDLTINKKSRYGTELFFRNVSDYNRNNNAFQSLSSIYTTRFEIEARQPLLQGFGRAVNESTIEVARLNNDMSLLEFEEGVRNLIQDIENAYWDLQCAYRIVESLQSARDEAKTTWQKLKAIENNVRDGPTNTLQFEDLYLNFEVQLTNALRDLSRQETTFRFLLKLASTGDRIIEPIDEPVAVPVQFNWQEIQAEALVRRPELRKQKYAIKQRELGILVAKNQMLPSLNVVGLYRWLGVGDELWSAQGSGIRFPNQGSRAFEELAIGEYQEARFGVELVMPKYRHQIASVRNSQLALMRDRATLETMENAASHALMNAVRDVEVNFDLSKRNRKRIAVTRGEIDGRVLLADNRPRLENPAILTALFDAHRRNSDANINYHQNVCNYNKSIAFVHYRKGSLFEFNHIRLAEIPWHAGHYYASHDLSSGATPESIDYRTTPAIDVLPAPAEQSIQSQNAAAHDIQSLPPVYDPANDPLRIEQID